MRSAPNTRLIGLLLVRVRVLSVSFSLKEVFPSLPPSAAAPLCSWFPGVAVLFCWFPVGSPPPHLQGFVLVPPPPGVFLGGSPAGRRVPTCFIFISGWLHFISFHLGLQSSPTTTSEEWKITPVRLHVRPHVHLIIIIHRIRQQNQLRVIQVMNGTTS